MDVNINEECKNDQLLEQPPTKSEAGFSLCSLKSATSDIPAPAPFDSNKNLDNEDLNNNDGNNSEWTEVDIDKLETGAFIEAGKVEPILMSDKENKEDIKKLGDIPNRLRKNFQTEEQQYQEAMNSKKSGCQNKGNNNNNNDCLPEYYDDRSFLFALEDDRRNNWKEERRGYFGNEEDYRMRFPWKRIAYIGVLLVLGITCAILVLMKLCGGADWMNTATFSVIIMGTVMLLPPGLYYGRILICICCRCKEYSVWDVPAGPFG